jgi:glycosyltransferase involved in cell wall biosynthesis
MGRLNVDSERKAKVIMVIDRFFPIFGGAETQCFYLTKQLQNNNKVQVEKVLTRKIQKGLSADEIIEGIKIKRLGIPGLKVSHFYLFCFILFIYLILKKNQYDIIHCHATGVLGLVVIFVSKLTGKPHVLKVTTAKDMVSQHVHKEIDKKNIWGIVKHFLKLKDIKKKILKEGQFVAISKEIEEELKGLGAKKIHKIPNGISLDRFHKIKEKKTRSIIRQDIGWNTEKLILTYTGRIVYRKGIDVLIEAVSKLSDTIKSNIEVHIIGSGRNQIDSVEEEMKIKVQDKGLEHVVIFDGEKKNIEEFLAATDIFVFPSRNEGLSNSLLEAAASKLICIVSDIGGNVDIIDDRVNGYIFKNENSQELSSLISFVIENYYTLNHIKEECYTKIKCNFSIDKIANDYEKLYQFLLREN